MRRTILLADDSPTIRRLVTQTFADGDFEIVSVNNGEAAIKKFDEVRPSVVLADIYMPGKNGYEVCSYIRNHPTLGTTPVILLVGAFDAFDEENAKQAGATANITKPFEPGALTELVLSLLPAEAPAPPPPAEAVVVAEKAPEDSDLLGLGEIFKEEEQGAAATGPAVSMTEEEIDRIADRVIQKLSTQVIESIAWDVVPDITEKVVREELKRLHEG
ncbi:MAG TPA: response regulator [Terriglobia bacterium]|nr:response regulator [Terriglobia bacterium]